MVLKNKFSKKMHVLWIFKLEFMFCPNSPFLVRKEKKCNLIRKEKKQQ